MSTSLSMRFLVMLACAYDYLNSSRFVPLLVLVAMASAMLLDVVEVVRKVRAFRRRTPGASFQVAVQELAVTEAVEEICTSFITNKRDVTESLLVESILRFEDCHRISARHVLDELDSMKVLEQEKKADLNS